MAPTKKTIDKVVAEATEKAIEQVKEMKEQPKAILGSMIKFCEAVKLEGDTSPITSANAKSGHVIKLLPNGWATIAPAANQLVPSYVPASNILYFIPKVD